MQLNVGSGSDDYQKGEEWVNIDRYIESPHHINRTRFDILADAEHLPFADDAFEHVRIRQVLEHLQRPYDVLREFHRVLEPGGEVFVDVPHPPSVKDEVSKYHTMHIYSWTKGSLMRIVQHAGFDRVSYHGHHAESVPGGHAVIARKPRGTSEK